MVGRMTDKPLTARQELFAQGVVAGLSQSAAYRKAYPQSLQWKPDAVHVAGAKMMAKGRVAVRIKELQDLVTREFVVETADLLRESARVAFSDIRGIMHADGRVKLPHELDTDTARAVSSFKIDEYGRVEYKFWDKSPASERLFKVKGMYVVDNKQKADALSDILNGLNGKVLGVTRDIPDEPGEDG
jgi:hypothetical protein